MHDAEGKIQGVVCMALDITERKVAEEELRKYREHLEELVKNRTVELIETNKQLQEEIDERKWTEESLIRSEEEARRLSQENAIMAEIGRIISSTLDIHEVYERLTEEVRKLIPFDRIAITLNNLEDSTVTIAYVIGGRTGDRRQGDSIPLAGSLSQEIIRTRSGLLIQMEDEGDLIKRFSTLSTTFQAGFRSVISVPLILKDEVIGTLHLRSTQPNAYTEKDLRLTERVGNQIAGAIANTQLFEEGKRTEEEKATLEEEFRQSQKIEAIGRLTRGIAHDFNNLLTIIKGNCELSLIKVKEGDPLKENIEEIHRASQRAAELIRQLKQIGTKYDPN